MNKSVVKIVMVSIFFVLQWLVNGLSVALTGVIAIVFYEFFVSKAV